MLNLPELRTLQEVREEYLRHNEPISYPIPTDINSLEPSELNRLYTMVSTSDGTIHNKYLRDLQSHLDSLPPRPQRRMKSIIEPNINLNSNSSDKNKLPRSRLIDQFYSHQLPGIEHTSIDNIRKLIQNQKNLRDSAINGTELLKIATKKLVEAFPDISHHGIGLSSSSQHSYQDDDQNRDSVTRIPKCPQKYMESSIAIVLEHTEHITLDIQRQEFQEEE
ncbi:hypothetical protein TRFO_13282 [Tritrichomonas foetus]|uniref:Uncharacterized protein n=1 Tax=Tritrichomonas foetus TaxID=1144522 RepID=A0A1J4L2Y6_9EUKA|nr:hypothetical protein TRFO_13282 [Tritrichomonas foetus]|eukprot:OHT16277.1 hypothetical protein TRFO_13282 [Tritrichomonas foetus]